MIILCINSGSSSVKFRLYDYEKKDALATGGVERVGDKGSFINYTGIGKPEIKKEHYCPDHKVAIKLIIDMILDKEVGVLDSLDKVSAVGHRVVQGGSKITSSVIVDEKVLQTFKDLYDLAPLHNPANVAGIEAAMEVLPKVPQMAILDTAWHATIPEYAYRYAVPEEWYTKYGIRRYGFHGSSFLYVSRRASVLLGKDISDCNLICLHIGNGGSANAIKKGKSFDTSMGLTPLEGLIMGTRSGDIDPAIPLVMMEKEKMSATEMNGVLNKKCGVFAITGKYTDRRDIETGAENGDEKCQLSIEMESYRTRKYIGAYMAAIGGADAIVFTGGVGERGPIVRERALQGLECMGIILDKDKNDKSKTITIETEISTPESKVKVYVIPTDEEIVFIEDVVALLKGTYSQPDKFVYSFQKPEYVNEQRAAAYKLEVLKKPYLEEIKVLPKQK